MRNAVFMYGSKLVQSKIKILLDLKKLRWLSGSKVLGLSKNAFFPPNQFLIRNTASNFYFLISPEICRNAHLHTINL